MLDISLDKRLELLSGLQYYVAKKNNLTYHWIKENYKEYNGLFYELCDKYISKELEKNIFELKLKSNNNEGQFIIIKVLAFDINNNQ